MASYHHASEATARVYPKGARGPVRGLLLGLFEEEITTSTERDERDPKQHVGTQVGLAHGVDITRLAVGRTTFDLVLFVSPVERVDAPRTERHQPHAAEYVRKRIA